MAALKAVRFAEIRRDWYAGADFMARALQRELEPGKENAEFIGFPRQWIPLFEWIGAAWSGSCDPEQYVPFFSGRTEGEILRETKRSRDQKQLRLLVELAASADIVLCETLQRIDGRLAHKDDETDRIVLTTWHGYSRRELTDFDLALADYRFHKKNVVFIACSRRRPYQESSTFRRLKSRLDVEAISDHEFERVVITSIGPVPERLWDHPTVLRYDTGVRDLYRLLVQLRRLLTKNKVEKAWDFLPLVQYGDVLDILSSQGLLPPVQRPKIRRRNIPTYRFQLRRRP